MTTRRRVSEKELHAYLDGELPPERAAAVEEYLEENEDEARRLAAYRADGEAIRRIFGAAGRRDSERDAEQMARRRVVEEV